MQLEVFAKRYAVNLSCVDIIARPRVEIAQRLQLLVEIGLQNSSLLKMRIQDVLKLVVVISHVTIFAKKHVILENIAFLAVKNAL